MPPIKLLHTADWHIGQLFHDYDRSYEHPLFLDWLVDTITAEQIDVLLVSGDIFDISNPSAASIRLFYTFLNRSVLANPHLQIIVTAGNHDSANRLEAPKPLLESSNIHIIGVVSKHADGSTDYDQIIIPISDKNGDTKAFCIAAPFLRLGDYPAVSDCANPYAEGVAMFYAEAFGHANKMRLPDQAIIAMGHLHAQTTSTSDMDKAERIIMGGVESIGQDAFHTDIAYVALGHIHKAQRIGGLEHIRYCGSPIPMSFSEIHYKHQGILFDLEGTKSCNMRTLEVPVAIPLKKVPSVHSRLPEVLQSLGQLPETKDNLTQAPSLEVRVLEDSPEPARRHKIETALQGKHVRLTKIDVRHNATNIETENHVLLSADQLSELTPADVFTRTFRERYKAKVPGQLLDLFHQIAQEVASAE